MRILHITSHLNLGGVSSYIVALSKVLRHRGHRVIVASGGGVLVDMLRTAGIDHWHASLHTSAEFSLQVVGATRVLAQHLRQEPVDLIHAHTRVGQLVADRLWRQLRIPVVTTWHGFFRPNLGRRLWPCTGAVTMAISDPVYQHLRQDFHVPPERLRLIPNGVDVEHFAHRPDPAAVQSWRARWGLPERGAIIGGMGRLASGRVKGFDVLLLAMRRLAQQRPDAHVLIVGDGPRRPFLDQKIIDLNLRERVHFTGPVMDVRVPLALMDVFAFPVRWKEGFGLALIEAMATGLPVVASRTGAITSVIEDGVHGRLVSVEDDQALANVLLHLLQDPAGAQRLGRAGQERVRQAFSLGRLVDQVEAVYREVTKHEG